MGDNAFRALFNLRAHPICQFSRRQEKTTFSKVLEKFLFESYNNNGELYNTLHSVINKQRTFLKFECINRTAENEKIYLRTSLQYCNVSW